MLFLLFIRKFQGGRQRFKGGKKSFKRGHPRLAERQQTMVDFGKNISQVLDQNKATGISVVIQLIPQNISLVKSKRWWTRSGLTSYSFYQDLLRL